ncbi:phosphoribosylglycinamide formyltransferase [Sphingomonas baiyangensis]|uniref:Phosphoribosylglycinamide formyltransferase n=1 Tax=Sphingomonas baiyangensis TaxID=2572576 RepID=A0A4U1L3C9_9SPHN|nr:phosphoribosylglycinamide formyltransferase [Sphingomonas baiyangensis]TKD51182.1 phosphoribosylglycinamide formyltransferase [Sphingomonas baiyangensis]
MVKRRVGVMISGRGSNLKALHAASQAEDSPYSIVMVVSDNAAAPGLDWATENGIPTFATSADDGREGFEHRIHAALEGMKVEAIALAGFMRILSPEFVARWQGRIVNIHPSLLPKYPGLDTHARAIAAGDEVAGATVHVVTDKVDDGPIIGTAEVPVEAGDTPETLAARVLEAEHELYPQALAHWLTR